jgi:hypothetical protein
MLAVNDERSAAHWALHVRVDCSGLIRVMVLQLFTGRSTIGNGFEFVDTQDFLRLASDVGKLRSI